MEARAKIFGHPIHQMLIPFPLGLLGTAVVFEAIYLVWGNPTMATVAYWMIVAGIVGGLLAAPFGLIDYLAIPGGTRAKSVGLLHGGGNVVVLLLFAASWWLRSDDPARPELLASVLAFAGALLSIATGWLGGELVDRLSVGVDDGANLDAPSSLSGMPAGARGTGQRAA
jgi:uncharacterized membrane protein